MKKRNVKSSSGRLQSLLPARIFGQIGRASVESSKPFMSLLLSARRAVAFCFLALCLGFPAVVFSQTNYYSTNGTEYNVIGSLPGDQVFPDEALSSRGGFIVWQDNITDGDGAGISARRLDGTLAGTLSTFRVNVDGTGNQERPRVALLKDGGAVFVWQGGVQGKQHIYARFLTSSNTFLTSDISVSAFANNFQTDPAVTVLNNSNIVVVWGSFNQASSNSYQDVYAKILSPSGQVVSNEFLVNQFQSFNQRNPAVTALKNGGFAVAWVTEQQSAAAPNLGANTDASTINTFPTPSVDVYARLFSAGGAPVNAEFPVNTGRNPCSNPAIAAAGDGGFYLVWSARDMDTVTNGYDIFGRSFDSTGNGGTVVRINSHLYGDQYLPKISVIGADYLVAWTSLAQDGSREGVFGQRLNGASSLVGNEFRVNTTTASQQMHQTVASDGVGQFLVVWTSYTGSPNNFDLYAQRYLNVASLLQAMDAPFVYAPFTVSNGVYQPQLQISWPALLGISVANYEVYVDGSATPLAVTPGNVWVMTATNGLTAGSTHTFAVDYVTTDGRRSPLSPVASGKTWSGISIGGIPIEWLVQYYGNDGSHWPAATADSDGDGKNTLEEFLSGTNPTDASSVLAVKLNKTSQGLFLNWPTQKGLTYQVQVTTNLISWSNLGGPRFAADVTDSIYVGGNSAGYYRVVLLRQ